MGQALRLGPRAASLQQLAMDTCPRLRPQARHRRVLRWLAHVGALYLIAALANFLREHARRPYSRCSDRVSLGRLMAAWDDVELGHPDDRC